MPYFKNDKVNILFIHIPKTGGTSITDYLSNKYIIKLNNQSLYGTIRNIDNSELTDKQFEIKINIKSHMQHMTYQQIYKYSNDFNIDFNNISIITVVRNPYERIISALFYEDKINIESTPEDVFDILNTFLFTKNPDNFNEPQYLFITDENKELIPNLKILHTESLANDMADINYTDFEVYHNVNPDKTDYYKLLNNDSINLINQIYDIDFRLFNYNKIITMPDNITQTQYEYCNTESMSIIIDRTQLNIDDSLYILNNDDTLDTLFPFLPTINNTSYRLNTQVSDYDPLEQYVSQIAKFHSSRLNLSNNKTSCVEFSIVTPTVNQCNIVYDHHNYEKINKKNSPIFSIIVSLSDYTYQFLLTDINHQQYKYKQFDQSQNKLFLFKKHMHLVFDSSKYHGFIDALSHDNIDTSNPYLLINLWSYPLDNIPYYSSQNVAVGCDVPMKFTDINSPTATHIIETSCLNYNFFDRLLYNSELILDDELMKSISSVNLNPTHRIIMKIKNDTEPIASTCDSSEVTSDKKHNINTWMIDDHIYQDKIIQDIDINEFRSTTFLLDLTKNKYTLLEKYVYDTAMFHLSRLNIHDMENHYVEFWCKSNFENHTLHVDCDEKLKLERLGNYVYPLLSCVTYLNDSPDFPTIITNIDMDCYKYKEFDTQNEVILSFPLHNKQITFDGSFFHGTTSLADNQHMNERYIISINFWKTKPHDVKYYKQNVDSEFSGKILFSKNESLITLREDTTNIHSVPVCDDTINYSLFNDILYNKIYDSCYKFNNFIKTTICNKSNTFKFILDKSIKEDKKYAELTKKYGVIMDDIRDIRNNDTNLKYNNRFLQRFSFSNIYSVDMCRYIINESEKYATENGGWMTNRHVSYPTTDLPVDKIPSIFGIVLESLNTIMKKISISYELHNDMAINIKDLFVVKYSHESQNKLETHKDGSFISFNILLNESGEFEGGGTLFDDGLTYHSEQGNMLIHSSRINHSGLPITKGYRYLLVGFLDIEF